MVDDKISKVEGSVNSTTNISSSQVSESKIRSFFYEHKLAVLVIGVVIFSFMVVSLFFYFGSETIAGDATLVEATVSRDVVTRDPTTKLVKTVTYECNDHIDNDCDGYCDYRYDSRDTLYWCYVPLDCPISSYSVSREMKLFGPYDVNNDGTDDYNWSVVMNSDPQCEDDPKNNETTSSSKITMDSLDSSSLVDSQLGISDNDAGPISVVDGISSYSQGEVATTEATVSTDASASQEICNNYIDDDGNSFVDCLDQSCIGQQGPLNADGISNICEYSIESLCVDSYDNDNDSLIDCYDTDCSSEPSCDLDGDGTVNPNDVEADVDSCVDTFDNDGDSLIDCADPGCVGIDICGDSIIIGDVYTNDDIDDSDISMLTFLKFAWDDASFGGDTETAYETTWYSAPVYICEDGTYSFSSVSDLSCSGDFPTHADVLVDNDIDDSDISMLTFLKFAWDDTSFGASGQSPFETTWYSSQVYICDDGQYDFTGALVTC